MFGLFKKKTIDGLSLKLPREELLRKGRILIIDDEEPAFLADLRRARFSADHLSDVDQNNMDVLDRPTYDLMLLDFGNVGRHFGNDQGLSLLRHIKRVNPSVIVFAYTSKALKIEHADFYRLTDGSLAKDAGIQESLQKIEEGLRKAFSIANVWSGLLAVCDIKPGSADDLELQDLFVRGLSNKKKMQTLQNQVVTILTSDEAKRIGSTLVTKAIELGIKAVAGG